MNTKIDKIVKKVKWTQVVKILLIVTIALEILQTWKLWQEPQLPQILMVVMLALFIGAFVYGYYSMKLTDEGKTLKYRMGRGISILLIAVILALGIAYSVLSLFRPSVSDKIESDKYTIKNEQGYQDLAAFVVKYEDNYYMNLNIKNEYPVTIQVTDHKGNEVFSNTAMKMDRKAIKIRLTKGTYELRVSFASDKYQGSKVDMDYDIH